MPFRAWSILQYSAVVRADLPIEAFKKSSVLSVLSAHYALSVHSVLPGLSSLSLSSGFCSVVDTSTEAR